MTKQQSQDEINEPPPAIEVADMASLIARVREFLDKMQEITFVHQEVLSFKILSAGSGFTHKNQGKPEVILSEDVFVELGHPSTASRSVLLITYDPKFVHHGRVSIVGPDLDNMETGCRRAFAQVVMLAVDRNLIPDPFNLENTQYLMHRLPGYMVRSVPGRLWVRVGKKQRALGLNLHVVGSALADAYTRDFEGVTKAEVVFVTSNNNDVAALDIIGTEAKILSGQHKKLVLGVDGSVECTELSCETCDQKPICDNLRDIVIKRRKQKKASG